MAAERTGESGISYLITSQGSTPVHREDVDSSTGNVYIYLGGAFPKGTHFVNFQYVFDAPGGGLTSGSITPVLFEQTSPGVYTVRGIGRSFPAVLETKPQTIPFIIVAGEKVTANKFYTFGYINAVVDGTGIPVAKSQGTVDYDYSVDTGFGVGGLGTTNTWGATNALGVVVSLGTTFGVSSGDFTFLQPLRTYSAQVSGVVVVP